MKELACDAGANDAIPEHCEVIENEPLYPFSETLNGCAYALPTAANDKLDGETVTTVLLT